MRESTPNHTIDPETGFLESNNYIQSFDADKKKTFLKLFKENGLKFWRTCAELGVKGDTVHKHASIDPAFNQAIKEAKRDFYDDLEGVSRINALNPHSVIERIFQLKAAFPDRYGDNKKDSNVNISINLDGKLLESATQRQHILDVKDENVTIAGSLPEKSEVIDNQQVIDETPVSTR